MSDFSQLEQLKLINSVIARMNSSSNLIKNITSAIATGIILFGIKEGISLIFFTLYILILPLAYMDMVYLYQERLFKELYTAVASGEITTYSMSRESVKGKVSIWTLPFSHSIYPFYLPFVVINTVLICWRVS